MGGMLVRFYKAVAWKGDATIFEANGLGCGGEQLCRSGAVGSGYGCCRGQGVDRHDPLKPYGVWV